MTRRARQFPAGPRGGIAPARVLRVHAGGAGAYRIIIGPGVLGRLVTDVVGGWTRVLEPAGSRAPHRLPVSSRQPPAGVVVVSDRNVARLYGEALTRALRDRGAQAHLVTFPGGESSKTRETKSRLEDRLARLRLGRDGIVVALGGGVTGDLAGFLAATWHRGVPLIQAPTSLTAMLDASIGGKVGVDHPLGKNLIGAYHAPLAVYADTATLATLPDRDFRSGIAEAVKCGVIAKGSLFAGIERERDRILRREPAALVRLVEAAAAVKAEIVSRDERESGRRMLLNFGHTLGHALEAVSGYRLRHGEAVAIGMVLEARIARRLGLLPETIVLRIERLLEGLGLPTRLRPRRISVRAILAAAERDKKRRSGRVLYALPRGIGRHAGGSAFALTVPEDVVREVLREELA